MKLVDTHCHLDDSSFVEDFHDVYERALFAGMCGYIIPGAAKKDLERAVALSEKYENIYFAVGIHPYEIDSYDEEYLTRYITHKKCVAVGECGLDYFRLPEDCEEKLQVKAAQKRIFAAQIRLAESFHKPLIVHIRDASFDSLEMLKHVSIGGVLHCYNADEQLMQLTQNGFYFGIGGVVTFKNARRLVEILPKIPLERLLFETDAPYLTPTPHRGSRNEPAYVPLIVQKVAEILDKSIDELATQSIKNTNRLFRTSF